MPPDLPKEGEKTHSLNLDPQTPATNCLSTISFLVSNKITMSGLSLRSCSFTSNLFLLLPRPRIFQLIIFINERNNPFSSRYLFQSPSIPFHPWNYKIYHVFCEPSSSLGATKICPFCASTI
ncbi:hypothetical protein PRUPE_4G281100 [Prunus persica]|uniref:Uncharacterized protein n=1 Tax=Prunus persica TaxID=3760 RepID=A0A251PS84_PRUPE|nr:hypothetical protein PRUPE_4G281100 [Prunus persica]